MNLAQHQNKDTLRKKTIYEGAVELTNWRKTPCRDKPCDQTFCQKFKKPDEAATYMEEDWGVEMQEWWQTVMW